MTFLAIDHSSNLEDGLYTGEEICAMLGENDGGIEQVGVEMELDPDFLSMDMAVEDDAQRAPLSSQHDHNGIVDRRRDADETGMAEAKRPKNNRSAITVDRSSVAVVNIGQTVKTKRTFGGKLQILKRQLLTKATSRLKIMVVQNTSPLPSPKAQKVLQSADQQQKAEQQRSDNSTCDMTHASLNSSDPSSIASSRSYNDSSMAPSSITASTCDFAPDPNLHAVFESYLMTNPWDAAKRGDYATLTYIANHDDANIWTQKDEFGQVPLYYACTHYSQWNGQSFGKYGLESIKLLVEAWPNDVDFPKSLLELCSKRNSIHKDVVEVLSKSNKSTNTVVLRMAKKDWKIEGTSDVIPVSFLEDLGDDGYVEDY